MNIYLEIKEIKKMVIKAFFSNDFLYDQVVLKGGTALEILGFNQRASMDIDFSMPGTFDKDEIETLEISIKQSLSTIFNEKDLNIIDLNLVESPAKMSVKKSKYWGGYVLEFKIIHSKDYDLFKKGEKNLQALRTDSMVINPSNQKKKFQVDISKFEYCETKESMDLDGHEIYIYSPAMMVYEKLRAICQQSKQYKKSEGVSRTPRARDFFDIHSILEENHDDYLYETLKENDNLEIIKQMFKLKKVPIDSLENINSSREYHRDSFVDVKDTVANQNNIESYDFYFDYVVRLARDIAVNINSQYN